MAKKFAELAEEKSWPERHVSSDGNPVPFHRGQILTFDSQRRTIAMIAGTQSGKTALGPHWIKQEIDRLGRGDYYAVTASYDLFKLKMLPSFLEVFEQIYDMGRFWSGDKVFELRDPETGQYWANKSTDPMWGRVILRSAQSVGGLESGTGKAAWLDEAGQPDFTVQAWNAILRRLAIHQGRILLTTTLYYSLGWMKTEVIDKAKFNCTTSTEKIGRGELDYTDNKKSDISLIQFDSIINPTFPEEEYERARERMAEDEFALFYRGRISRPRKLIYDIVDEKCYKKPFTIPKDWPVVVGIDPIGAYVGALFIAIDPTTFDSYVFKEYREPFGITTSGHVENILQLSKKNRVIAWVGGGPSETQARLDWTGFGIPLIEPPFVDVWSQIQRVYASFKTHSLFIFDNLEYLKNEVDSYARKVDRAGNITDLIEHDELYHLLSCLRYAMSWLTQPAEGQQIVYNPIQIGNY